MTKITLYNNFKIFSQSKIVILTILLIVLTIIILFPRGLKTSEATLEQNSMMFFLTRNKDLNFAEYERFKNYFCQLHGLSNQQCEDQFPTLSEFNEHLEYAKNTIQELEELTKKITNWQMMDSG